MEKVMHESPETKAIRLRMEEVRCDLDEGVQEIVEGARDMGEWRTYVRSYPWVCLGAALAAGYWIVPPRTLEVQPNAETLAELTNQSRLLATSHMPPKCNARGKLLAFVGNLVMRGVTSCVSQQTDKFFSAQPAKTQPGAPP